MTTSDHRRQYEFEFHREQKRLHAQAMWFRFSSMLVAHGIVVGIFTQLGPSPSDRTLPIEAVFIFGQLLTWFWYMFMHRSHAMDLKLDKAIKVRAKRLFITIVKAEDGINACIPMYGTILAFSMLYNVLYIYAKAIDHWLCCLVLSLGFLLSLWISMRLTLTIYNIVQKSMKETK